MLALAAGYGMVRLSGRVPRESLKTVGAALDLNWLYGSVEHSLDTLRGPSRVTLDVLGSTLYLGWALLWGLLITHHLVEG